MSLALEPSQRPRFGPNVFANYAGKLWGVASICLFAGLCATARH
jgi:hypothetical protein